MTTPLGDDACDRPVLAALRMRGSMIQGSRIYGFSYARVRTGGGGRGKPDLPAMGQALDAAGNFRDAARHLLARS